MAIWQDPQTTGVTAATVGVPRAARDVGLRSYMLSVYNYMASGVLLTGLVALFFAQSGLVYSLFNAQTGSPSIAGWIVMIAPFALVMVLSFGINRLSDFSAQALFWGYAALMGASLS